MSEQYYFTPREEIQILMARADQAFAISDRAQTTALIDAIFRILDDHARKLLVQTTGIRLRVRPIDLRIDRPTTPDRRGRHVRSR